MTDTPLHLGRASTLPQRPEDAVLDYVPNPRPGKPYLVRFTAPEFTSLCPVTGQPDFAHLVIDYAPGATIVESKALKLFLGSFRNHAGFHEDCTVGIGERRQRAAPTVEAAGKVDRVDGGVEVAGLDLGGHADLEGDVQGSRSSGGAKGRQSQGQRAGALECARAGQGAGLPGAGQACARRTQAAGIHDSTTGSARRCS